MLSYTHPRRTHAALPERMDFTMAMQCKRDFLSLNRDIIQGKAGKKVLFQPRIDCWYHDRIFRDGTLPPPYDGLSRHDLYCTLDVSPRVYEFNGCVQAYDKEPVKRWSRKISDMEQEIHIETPVGEVTYLWATNDSNGGWYFKTFPAKTEEDLKVMIWLENNTLWRWNQAHYDNMVAEWGNMGLPSIFVPRVTIQKTIVEVMGVEGTVYGLADFPETMEEFFEASENSVMRMIEVIKDCPLEWINYGDNVHGGVVSPRLFEKYIMPAYLRRNEELHKAGKFTFAHWDGDCKPLLKYARKCGLDGIEAMTPVPQGDVTIDEIKEALGDEVFLVDGIPAILFDEIYPEQQLLDTVQELIDKFAPRLILGISDEMSSTGNIERIKLVRDYVDAYNAKCDKEGN